MKKIERLLKPKGDYTKTDLEGYADLSSSKIRSALLQKKSAHLFKIFNLIENKDSSLGAEIFKRTESLCNKFFTHDLGSEHDENIEELIRASVMSRIYGLSVVEIYLKEDMSLGFALLPREVLKIEDGEDGARERVLLKVGKSEFEAKEPRFLILRENPVLLRLLWIVYAKHFVLSHYLKFTEFLGVPPLIANASSGDERTISQIAEALSHIKSGSFAVVGAQDMIRVLEGRGSQADFMEFVRYCDAEIAKVINGSILSSNTQSNGSYAMSQTHELNRHDILAGDMKAASRLVAQVYKRLELTPNLNIQIEKDEDLLKRAQMLQILHQMGYEMSKEAISREFDLPLEDGAKNARMQTQTSTPEQSTFTKGIYPPFKHSLNGIQTSQDRENTSKNGLSPHNPVTSGGSKGHGVSLVAGRTCPSEKSKTSKNGLSPHNPVTSGGAGTPRVPLASGGFAFVRNQNKKAIDDFDEYVSSLDTQEEEQELLHIIQESLESAQNFSEVLEALSAKFSGEKLAKLEESLTRILTNAYVKGGFDECR